MAGDASGFAASRENSAGVERNRRRLRARSRNPALRPPPQTPSGVTPAQTAPELTRFEHAPSGRQTPAKRKYVEDRRLGEWRRGESNPRPKAQTGVSPSAQESPSTRNPNDGESDTHHE